MSPTPGTSIGTAGLNGVVILSVALRPVRATTPAAGEHAAHPPTP